MALTLKALQIQIDSLVKEVEKLKSERTNKILIKKKLEIGDTFELVGLTWKILDITESGYMCLADKLSENRTFDSSSNDWKSSKLRTFLNSDFHKKLADEIGEENIVPFERDLLSLDGQTEYGRCEDKVSLLTVDEYRKYRELIPNAGYWWWLCSPFSTKCNKDTTGEAVVSPDGGIRRYCYGDGNGVRPVCIFSSALFESEDK